MSNLKRALLEKRKKQFNSFILFGVFLLLYTLLFIYALIFKHVSPIELFSSDREYLRGFNVIPFHTIYSYISGSQNIIIVASNILGNIILFVPLGIYLQLLKKNKKIWISILIVFLITMFVEAFQVIFGLGVGDIDDIILNCLGGIIGILVYRGLLLLLKNEEKVRTAIVFSGFILMLIPILFTSISGLRLRLV